MAFAAVAPPGPRSTRLRLGAVVASSRGRRSRDGRHDRPTRRSICALYALLEEFFDFVAKSGGTCSTLSEAARGILAGPSPPVLRL